MLFKVCGMHHNVAEVAALEPDYLGFIFWEPSSRYFKGSIPVVPTSIKKVGVFVDASIEEIVARVKAFKLHVVQLHGGESPEFCRKLLEYAPNNGIAPDSVAEETGNFQLIKVFAVDENFDFKILAPYEDHCHFYLFDTKGKLPGGNGYAFNWELLKNYPSEKPYFLSGGIGPADRGKLQEFFASQASVHCMAIDINSRFEKAPGLKKIKALRKFMNEIKQQY